MKMANGQSNHLPDFTCTPICSYDMLICMRTTLNLQSDLLQRAKEKAAHENRTLTSVIEDALRTTLAQREKQTRKARIVLPTFKGRGLRPGVDLDDSAALLDLMEGR